MVIVLHTSGANVAVWSSSGFMKWPNSVVSLKKFFWTISYWASKQIAVMRSMSYHGRKIKEKVTMETWMTESKNDKSCAT